MPTFVDRIQPDDSIGAANGHRAERQRIQERKDDRINGNSDAERHDRGCCKQR
jgi:hypothetical protein